MNIDQLLGEGSARIGLIGAGQFGAALIGQAPRVPGLEVALVCDLDPQRAKRLCEAAGFDNVQLCDNPGAIASVIQGGGVAITGDAGIAAQAPVDMIVEATGHPAAAAACARDAIRAGNHVAMVTKEAESVVGAELHALAREAGVVYTPVDGDQPSLLIGMIGWARRLGLDIVCAGKSSEYDFVFDAQSEHISWLDQRIHVPGFSKHWSLPTDNIHPTLRARSAALAALPQRTVPDLTEMAVVANATSFTPDVEAFHVPVARTVEVPNVFRLQKDGGLLSKTGVIDVFNCLRRPDEASFAGGVFVVVACRDRQTWELLRDKGHPVSADGGYGMLYNPQHLLGLEAATTVLSAVLLKKSSGNPLAKQVLDVVPRAARDYRAGEVLSITDQHHHEVSGLDPLLRPAMPLNDGNAVPYYLATDRTLRRDVAAGEVLRVADVDLGESALLQLRHDQDARFFSS